MVHSIKQTESRSLSYLCLFVFKNLVPSLIPIFLCDLLLVYIYAHAFEPSRFYLNLFGYIILESIATFLIGFIADRWNRRYILLFLHLTAVVFLVSSYFYASSIIYIILFVSLFFNPNPVCRASLIDNYKSAISHGENQNLYSVLSLTELKLISISWLVQYTPWILFPFIIKQPTESYLLLLILGLLISFLFIVFFFKDQKDLKKRNEREKLLPGFKKIPYTFLSFLLAQSVFFSSFDKIHALTHQVYLFCLVGIGSFMSTTFSFFYKKNSHISVTTSAYLYGFILSMISLLYLIGTAESFPIELEIILLAAIGGVYIPYIYVIIAEHSRAKGRSTMFAVAEIVQISASLIGSILNLLFLKNSVILFSITSLLFLLAFLLQIRGKSV